MAYHENVHEKFRTHFEQTYEGSDYPSVEPYYQFGYDYALDEDFEGLTYEEAESRLRELYRKQYPNRDYDVDEPAIRYAYDETRRTRT